MKSIQFFTLGLISLIPFLYGESTALIDHQSYAEHGLLTHLKEAFKGSLFTLIAPDKATYETYTIFINKVNAQSEKVSFAVHYAKFKSNQYQRMLTFSEPESSWLVMSEDKRNNYLRHMSLQIVRQLEIEADLAVGEKLKPGYFKNLGHVTNSFKDASERSEPKQQVESAPIQKLQVDVVTAKTADHATLQSKTHDIDVTILERQFQDLESQMLAAKPQKRSELYTKQALIYTQIGDTDEALSLLNKALELNPNHEQAKKLKQKLLPPPLDATERFKTYLKSNHFKFFLKNKFEYDSNIVLEQKDPSFPTNKDDLVFSSTLGLSKLWSEEHHSQYSFYVDLHAENNSFNLMAHTLSHTWIKAFNQQWTLAVPLSASHYSLDHEKLLGNADLGPSLIWSMNPSWSSSFELGYRDSHYFDDTNEGLDSHQTRLKTGLQRSLNQNKSQFVKLNFSYIDEKARLANVSYHQIGFDLSYDAFFKQIIIDRLSINALLHTRDYDKFLTAINSAREDERLTLKLNLSKRVSELHSLSLDLNYQENDSNLNASKYDKLKAGLSWTIAL